MASSKKRILLVLADEDTIRLVQHHILSGAAYDVSVTRRAEEAPAAVARLRPDLLILGDSLPDGDHLALAAQLLEQQPTLPIILFSSSQEGNLSRQAIRLGLVDWITPPIGVEDFKSAVQRGLARSQHWHTWLQQEAARYTGPLLQQVDELQTLARVGRTVTAQLEVDRVLSAVVDAAVELTGAEEGSLLLLERETGDLYMRAARNFKDEFVRTFRIKAEDSLAGEVMRTGEPLFFDAEAPHKLKTEYLVHALIYVPLTAHGQTVGVLGVDNRETARPFEKRHAVLLTALADYAAIAIENARLFAETEAARGNLESILTQITDGVIVLDSADRVVLMNPAARAILGLPDDDLNGQPANEVLPDKTIRQVLAGESVNTSQIEIEGQDKRFYDLQVTAIEGVGRVITLHDISYLKEIDRIKSEFVNTVSHDLRSPLTAILGYVELISRVGPVTPQQEEFIGRAVESVDNITHLITDLLHLGRAEIGADPLEALTLAPIIEAALDGFRPQADKKQQTLVVEVAASLPQVEGNPVRLRQVLDNLIGNAIKYTPTGGLVALRCVEEGGQLILSVADTGVGIPAEEQNRIFDRFYRATNVPTDSQGTGLGLAITKQIVENHGGRIWLQSAAGGTTFTVVLPAAGALD